MKIHPEDKCICGHPNIMHDASDNWGGYCLLCFGQNMDLVKCKHKFRLDNLTYIEKLVKENNLI